VSIERLKKEFDIRTFWRGHPFHPEIPENGILIEDLMGIPRGEIGRIASSMENKAMEFGLSFKGPKKLFNTRLAQELGAWAQSEGKGDDFHNTAFRAYFVDGRDLSDKSVLTELAASVGLPEDKAKDVINNRLFKKEVDNDWSSSREFNIKAIPTFIMGSD
jgi:predicted DsbA family dithiol-disulfide isomerase